jgi:hypothetical protein
MCWSDWNAVYVAPILYHYCSEVISMWGLPLPVMSPVSQHFLKVRSEQSGFGMIHPLRLSTAMLVHSSLAQDTPPLLSWFRATRFMTAFRHLTVGGEECHEP